MTPKEFAEMAIANGHGSGDLCAGWDWIRANLGYLDYIWQSPTYIAANKYKSKCMPILLGDGGYTEREVNALATAWYLNNERIHKAEDTEAREGFKARGYTPITEIGNSESLHNTRVEYILDNTDECFGRIIEGRGRLFWAQVDKALMLLPGKNRRRGIWANDKMFIKFITKEG